MCNAMWPHTNIIHDTSQAHCHAASRGVTRRHAAISCGLIVMTAARSVAIQFFAPWWRLAGVSLKDGYPKFREDFTITENAPTPA